MQTSILFNINAKAPKTNDSLMGKASAIDLFADKKADSFNTAYKTQLNKRSEQKSRQFEDKDKSLPQSGNDLPDKKLNNDKQAEHAEEKVNGEQNNDSEKQAAQEVETGREHASKQSEHNSHKQSDRHQQENEQPVNENKASAEAESADEKFNETINNITYQQQTELNVEQEAPSEDTAPKVDQQLFDSEIPISDVVIEEAQKNPEVDVLAEGIKAGHMVSGFKAPDTIANDKKTHSEFTSGQQSLYQPFSSNQINSELASKTGSDSKNDSALGKSIADFQHFIEMSKKHSSAGEPIASVKDFQNNLKTELLNTQMMRNEIKLPAGQNLTPVQLAMQTMSSERMNPASNLSSVNLIQNLPSLEVKTTVGKPGWNQGFSQQIVMMASNGIQQAKIKLNPVHLGPVEAMVKLNKETAVVNLTSLHLTTKEAMDTAIPRLKEMLNENGFSQVDVNVSHQDKKSQQEANLSSNQERSDSEHGNSTMPGEEQLSEVNHDSDSDVQASESNDQGLNIVDYYA